MSVSSTRVRTIDWNAIEQELERYGCATVTHLLSPAECDALSNGYSQDLYRSRVVMKRHGFGSGEYKYFKYPLPALIDGLRTAIYPHLVPIANRWSEALGNDVRYPEQQPNSCSAATRLGNTTPHR